MPPASWDVRETVALSYQNGTAIHVSVKAVAFLVYHFSPPYNLSRGLVDRCAVGRLDLLFRASGRRGVDGALWSASESPRE